MHKRIAPSQLCSQYSGPEIHQPINQRTQTTITQLTTKNSQRTNNQQQFVKHTHNKNQQPINDELARLVLVGGIPNGSF
jgi:hypothetical protein